MSKLSEIVRQEAQSERYVSTGFCGLNLVNIANRIEQLEYESEKFDRVAYQREYMRKRRGKP
jgi:hypothetical protein